MAKIRQIVEKAREFQKNIYFHFTDYTKAFDSVDHNKLWKSLKVNTALVSLREITLMWMMIYQTFG